MGRLTQFALLMMLALLFTPAMSDDDQSRAIELLQQGEILPLEDILVISRQEIDGHILEVELEQERGEIIYEIEMLDQQGRVWELKIDATNGEILKRERE